MPKAMISVTEAARNFGECVNRAHYQNVTFVLLKNGQAVARLGPETEKICRGRDLAATLATTPLPDAAARAWCRDLQKARKSMKPPVDRWR